MFKKKTIKETIVEAARERFSHYGYGKTTMAEVASDCNMSPGNLYRYFQGKLDIAEEIVRRYKAADEIRLRALADQPGVSAVERLRAVLMDLLETTFLLVESEPRLCELVNSIIHDRSEVAEDVLLMERGIVADILADGNRTGELAVADVDFAAEIISAATTKFRYAQLRTTAPLERLKRELNGLVDLIVHGLQPSGTSGVGVGDANPRPAQGLGSPT